MPFLSDPVVAIAATGQKNYDHNPDESLWRALNTAATHLGTASNDRGPLAQVIPPGSRVLIKPNLVYHKNEASHGLAALLTHRSVINAAFRAAVLAGASKIVVGDAPIQSCDFEAMLRASGLDDWSQEAAALSSSFSGIRDLRSASSRSAKYLFSKSAQEEQFVVFDLGVDSQLEPVTDSPPSFRVTGYDPEVLGLSHLQGRHQYLISREALEASAIVNVPKLKMHKKAGMTCALKNMVGVAGSKDFLPHHRHGGTAHGGDAYPGSNRSKLILEYALDRCNSSNSSIETSFWRSIALAQKFMLRLMGDTTGIEGSWRGNDTVWRMILDLNRILIYGRSDGTMATTPQRTIIHFVDAVIAGQGNGPLAPEPLPLGLVLLGRNAAAIDWVSALLLGYYPSQIPLTAHAFGISPWPIANFSSDDVRLVGDFGFGHANDVFASWLPVIPCSYPVGWTQMAATRDKSDAPAPRLAGKCDR